MICLPATVIGAEDKAENEKEKTPSRNFHSSGYSLHILELYSNP
jgi:hypothetical protein